MAGIEVMSERSAFEANPSAVLFRMSLTKALIVAARIRDMDPDTYEQVKHIINPDRYPQAGGAA